MKAHAVFVVVFLSCLSVPFVYADMPKAVIGLTATMELDKAMTVNTILIPSRSPIPSRMNRQKVSMSSGGERRLRGS